MNQAEPDWSQVLASLEKIAASSHVHGSERLCRFLRFVVTSTLAGKVDQIKEYTIGTEVYGKPSSFDPRVDAIVRVEASKLRAKLAKYYETDGRSDAIQITIPKGSYVPVFARRIEREPPVWSRRFKIAAVLIGIGVASAGAWFARSRVDPSPGSLLVPLTSFPGEEREPSLSPDGNQVAFCWNGSVDGSNFDIYVKQVDSESLVRLTSNPAIEDQPAWSPDGRQIAFVREGAGIFVISPLGGQERKIADSGESPTWSPDGKDVVVADIVRTRSAAPEFGAVTPPASHGVGTSLFRIDVVTGGRRQITSPADPVDDAAPALSPDGRRLAFLRRTGPNTSDVYISGAGGENPWRLTTDNLNIAGLVWSGDSEFLIFSSNRKSVRNLWRARVRAATPVVEPVLIAEAGTHAFSPTLSRPANGKPARLAFQRLVTNFDVHQAVLDPADKPSAKILASSPLGSSSAADYHPQFWPDGRKTALVSKRSGFPEIWVCNEPGSACSQVTSLRGPEISSLRWSPTGRSILFTSVAGGDKTQVHVIDDSSRVRRVRPDQYDQMRAVWSRNGDWIYFGSSRSGMFQIWKVAAAGANAEPTQVTVNGGYDALESPDGRTLFYVKHDRPGLWRVPVAGGEEALIADAVAPSLWALSDRGIHFVQADSGEGGRSLLMFLSYAGGTPRTLGMLPKNFNRAYSGISVSPDGRRLLFCFLETIRSEVMMLDNFR